MNGETDLDTLLRSMSPALSAESFVFTTCGKPLVELAGLTPWALVVEAEGTAAVFEKEAAERNGLPFEGTFRRITLTVHSSLEAVGLTARVAGKLADRGISANVVAGFYHDHVFVPEGRAMDAMEALGELAGAAE